MDTAKYCQHCGKPLGGKDIRGLCPECMLKVGLGSTFGPAGAGEKKRFAAPTLAEVAKFFPQLKIIQVLGQGGMGAVYKTRQPALDRLVALKILPPEAGSDPDFAERFAREARALARLNHPNIVAVYEFGEAAGLHYFIMEYVDGVNLRQLQESGKLSSRDALKIIPQICEALQFAHDEGIVHRDIKPENVLLDNKGRVKIADFGLAKILGREPEALRLTGAKDLMGTPHYMAPEQVEHPQAVDHRADIYSLGVVFYEMLTGELPLGKFQPPSRKVQVDVRLDEVVMHALEKEPERRYQHASDVKSDVETIVTSSGGAAVRRADAEAGRRFTVKDLFLFGIFSGSMPLFVTRADGRKFYWPGVLLFCSTLGLVIYFVLFLFAFGGWPSSLAPRQLS
jgi:serine/threonine protein kinase